MLGFLPTRAYRPGTPGATTFLSPLSGTFNYGWDSFLERVGEVGIALSAADGALGEIDAASQIGEPCAARDGVEGGRNGSQPQPQVQRYREAVVREDHGPERRDPARRTADPARVAVSPVLIFQGCIAVC